MTDITLRDVAKTAGVSISTVSRVVRGKDIVHPETKRKVMKAVKKLNYYPNTTARAMVKKQTNTIGLIISDISNPFYPPLLRGVENTINKFGYSLILCNTDENAEKEKQYLKVMLEKRVDGLIVSLASPANARFLKEFEKRNIPIVCIDRKPENMEVDTVCVDNVQGAFMAVEHLLKIGHRRIGMVSGIRGITTTEGRVEGYLKALKDHGVDKSLIVEGKSTIEGAIGAIKELLNLDFSSTALFSCNNLITLGIYIGLKKHGKKIPKDIAVVGFDDLDWAEALYPPPTVVSQPTYAIGATAAQILIQRTLKEGPKNRQNIVLKTELIVRESCGAKSKKSHILIKRGMEEGQKLSKGGDDSYIMNEYES